MKITNNQKLILGLLVGGGIAYIFGRNSNNSNYQNLRSMDDGDLEKTREQKIAFIINNITAEEVKSEFEGDRFVYNPTIGYKTPVGEVDIQSAGEQMILPRQQNYANEVFFAVNGENNTVFNEAFDILNELSDRDLNLVYTCVLKRKNNPNVSFDEIIHKFNIQNDDKKEIKKSLSRVLNDIKALKLSAESSSFLGIFRRRNPCGTRPIFNRSRRDAWNRCMQERRVESDSNRPVNESSNRPIMNFFGLGQNRNKRREQVAACGTRPVIRSRRKDWEDCVAKQGLQ